MSQLYWSAKQLVSPPAPYSALIFDCDGTLADTMPLQFQAWSTSLQAFGAKITQEWYSRHNGLSTTELIHCLNQEFGYRLNPTVVAIDKRSRFHDLIPAVKPIQVIANIVRSHASKVPMAVASGGDRNNVEATLRAIGLIDYFRAVVCIDEVKQGKPEPDLFLMAAKKLGVLPTECILYEDSDSGLEAARRAGMYPIDVRVFHQPETNDL